MKERIIIFGLILLPLMGWGQQQTIFSQYMSNILAVNPAYAGHDEMATANFLMRFQSTGLKGAPNIQTFSIHSPFISDKVGLGLQMIHEQIGVSDQTGAYASYAYKLKVRDLTISLGLQAGANFYKSSYSRLELHQDGDASFTEDVSSVSPNFGAGVFVHNLKFYAGLSMPQMVRVPKTINEITQYRPLLLMGGYQFTLSEELKMKPSVLLKYTDQRPVQFDFNTMLIFKDIFLGGVTYRPNNAAVLLTQIFLTSQLKLGYSYDFIINSLSVATMGSHEVMLQYSFRLLD